MMPIATCARGTLSANVTLALADARARPGGMLAVRVRHRSGETIGMWDADDPVAHAILDIVEAQRELADAIADYAGRGVGGHAAINAAVEKRDVAGERLEGALEDRDSWPDPMLGLR
jgi:hypothetical protein